MFSKSYINEIWKPVRGYVGLYEVSNFGRIKSLPKWVERKRHNGGFLKKECILKPQRASGGYLHIALTKDCKTKCYYIHRLVWEAFNGSISEGYEINHINEDKTDNRLENLSLVTHKENVNWGTRIQRIIHSQHNRPDCSIPILQYSINGDYIAEYPSLREAERKTGIRWYAISACCKGKRNCVGDYFWVYKN